MKLMILFSVVIAASSLAGFNITSSKTLNVETASKQMVIFEYGKRNLECIMVRKGDVCIEYAADGICCTKIK